MNRLQYLELAGKRFVVLDESEYERLCRDYSDRADDGDGPPFPKANKDGNFPAEEYSRISIARTLIRERRSVRLSQQKLADLAHVRQETISRLESGKHVPSIATLDKLERAIETERKRRKKRKSDRA